MSDVLGAIFGWTTSDKLEAARLPMLRLGEAMIAAQLKAIRDTERDGGWYNHNFGLPLARSAWQVWNERTMGTKLLPAPARSGE
jgi:hypothetical protein